MTRKLARDAEIRRKMDAMKVAPPRVMPDPPRPPRTPGPSKEEIEEAITGLKSVAAELSPPPADETEFEKACPNATEALRVGAYLIDRLINEMQGHEDTLSWKNEFSAHTVSQLQHDWLPVARKRLGLE